MVDIIVHIIMIVGAFTAGYGVRALQKPEQKRDRKGRFIKRG